ncbi:DoxX family protein [Paenibacillus nasutitermitis]|nr:DoxX family protein [Paenibacillus nasutitermitis]
MIMKFLRENIYAAVLMLLLRLYVGWEWLYAGYHKLANGFDAKGYLTGAVAKPVADQTGEVIYPTFTAFLKHFALPNVKLFNFMIPLGEALIGIGLILGALTAAAAFFGLLMNFMFLFAGTISTNPWLVLLGGLIMIAGANGGRLGIDYYAKPYLRKLFHKEASGGTRTNIKTG